MTKITPRIDIAFKKIFGVEENKDLLISLINSIVSSEDQISDVVLLNPYNAKNFADEKLSILDIKASSTQGKKFNIEIQITDEADYDKRALYYWAKLYTEQLKTGEDYASLSKAIGIHILNFTSILGSEEYHNIFRIKSEKKRFNYFDDLELHTIELKKFSGCNSQAPSELLSKIHTALDAWAAFLTRHDLLSRDNLPGALSKNRLEKALNVIDVMNFSAEEREAYEGRLKWYQIEANTLKKAEAKGIEIGEARGIEIGEARGIEKMVFNLFKQNCNLNLICTVSGFSKETVEALYKRYESQMETDLI